MEDQVTLVAEQPSAAKERNSSAPVMDGYQAEDAPLLVEADSSSKIDCAGGGTPDTIDTNYTNGTTEDSEKSAVTSGSNSMDAAEMKKHQLEHSWALWVRRRSAPQADHGQRMFGFSAAEDFWCMHNHAFPPSKLVDIDTSLFHSGIEPVRDDPHFGTGGRWVFRVDKSQAHHLDDLWLSLIMAVVGEHFVDFGGADIVVGAVVSTRHRTTRLALWLSKATDEKVVLSLGHAFRDVLAGTSGVTDMYSKEFVFEDFRTQAISIQLPRPGIAGLTEGIFQ